MDLTVPWIIAKKEMYLIRHKKILLISFILLPLAVAVPIPAVIYFISTVYNVPISQLSQTLGPLQFLFVDIAFLIPLITATYSIVGEKVEQTLEPLLATPAKDSEILLGKDIGTMIPTVGSVLLGGLIFAVLSDVISYGQLGYLLFPNLSFGITILLVAPLSSYLITRVSVFLSARSTTVQSAQAYGRVMAIVFLSPIWLNFLGLFSVTSTIDLLIMAAIIFLAGLAAYYRSSKVFRREIILTRWR